MQQLLVLQQAVFDEQAQARVSAALAHAKASPHVLGRGRADASDEAHDLLVASGLHIGVSELALARPPHLLDLARAGSS
jgi:hypothetical protein